jgi:hypothetical protein
MRKYFPSNAREKGFRFLFVYCQEVPVSLEVQTEFSRLRVHDLIAKLAHTRLKDVLRVLVALRAVAEEYDLPLEAILAMPYSAVKPTPEQARDCERAYWWMYDNTRLNRLLFEIEQLH